VEPSGTAVYGFSNRVSQQHFAAKWKYDHQWQPSI